jgi:hypothetical protein
MVQPIAGSSKNGRTDREELQTFEISINTAFDGSSFAG